MLSWASPTCPDDKGRFEAKVRELTAPLEPSLFLPLNVQDADQMAEVFGEIKEKWGVLDGLVHCLAFAGKEELIGDYSATTAEGFARSLDISAYSLAPLCAHAKPLFSEKAGVITLSYLGAERAIPNYNVMGVAKAALEASVRYLAAELGPEKQVRVNAISAGPIRTLASSAIGGILDMIHNVEEKAPCAAPSPRWKWVVRPPSCSVIWPAASPVRPSTWMRAIASPGCEARCRQRLGSHGTSGRHSSGHR